MKEGFRQSMAWLHTWSGLVFGWLLFAIFLTGTLSYFKDEISHWMQPEIQVQAAKPETALALAQNYLQQHGQGAARWIIVMPQPREPALSVIWQAPAKEGQRRGTFIEKKLDPQSGAELHPRKTAGGDFFYRFHYQLEMPYPWGRWLTTTAAMVMFVALISGIIIHKKIFKDFFTFRPRKGQRTWLDGHNALGVLALPFHLMITYSSLVIFMRLVMPAPIIAAYGEDERAFSNEIFASTYNPAPAGQPGQLISLVPLYEQASQRWQGGRVAQLNVNNPGDLNASVNIYRRNADTVARESRSTLSFSAVTGQPMGAPEAEPVAMVIAGTFYGLHMGTFAGPVVRWLYFIFGLAGTAMIGTGLVIWLGKRQLKHAKSASMPFELRLVEVLNIASMSGLLIAVAAVFWANRVLPVTMPERAGWEVNTFFVAWILSLVHAALRRGQRAWVEQLAMGALLFAGVPLLNALTTQSHLGASIARGDWMLAGFDLTCLGAGIFLAWGAWKMQRAGAARATVKPRAERTKRPALEGEVG